MFQFDEDPTNIPACLEETMYIREKLNFLTTERKKN